MTKLVSDYSACNVPLRRLDPIFGGAVLLVHEGIVGDVYEAESRWKVLGGSQWFPIRRSDTGAYACRQVTGGSSYSPHSWGVAIDFNWQSNPYGPKRTPCPQQPQMEEFYEKCWKPMGYGWGGAWVSKCDAMHISKYPRDGGSGILYERDPQPPVQDWFDMATEQELEAVVERVVGERLEALLSSVGGAYKRPSGSKMTLHDHLTKMVGKDAQGAPVYDQHLNVLDADVQKIKTQLGIS